jgi:hypothetical protein
LNYPLFQHEKECFIPGRGKSISMPESTSQKLTVLKFADPSILFKVSGPSSCRKSIVYSPSPSA